MISYDTYQNKIKRVAAVKNFIVRFRALFIALFAVIVALICAFLFTKGMITQDIVLPEKVVYGDGYSIEKPKALFSSADYQFKAVNENSVKHAVKRAADEQVASDGWTYEMPTLAGKYLIRTVSKKTFGLSYGEPKEFTIEAKPAEFIIESDSIVYGGIPDSYTFNLINGDTLLSEGLKFDYANPADDITTICANSASFKIVNRKGEDVTFCYDISVPAKENVVIKPKAITFTPEPLTAEYDGKAVNFNATLTQSSIKNLNGDVAHIEADIYDKDGNLLDGMPINAGTYTVKINPDKTTVLNGGADVLTHYDITYASAQITITPRPITVTTASHTKEFDGTMYFNPLITEQGKAEGHTLNSEYVGEDIFNAGKYENKYLCTVTDAEGNDVSANYSFTYVYGEVEITPRKIKMTTGDFTKVYDGTSYFNLDDTSYKIEKVGSGEPFVEGNIPVVVFHYGDYAVNTYPNAATVNIIGGSAGNYDIEYVFGTLEITKRRIEVTTATDGWIYDGYAHGNTDITVSENTPLADGDIISVIQNTQITFYTQEAVKNTVTCAIYKAGFDVTGNYKINYNEGELKIDKRPVTITTPSFSRPYDGTYLTGYSLDLPVCEQLADGDSLSYGKNSAMLIFCGTVENRTEVLIKNSEDTDVFGNYDITFVYGTLEITKRDVIITTPSPFNTYDGTELKGDSREPVADNLASGEYLVAHDVVSLTNAGSVENKTQYYIYKQTASMPDDDGMIIYDVKEDINTTENYNITYICGTITVAKRTVVILTPSDTKEYDGTALTKTDGVTVAETSIYDLVSGHELKVDTGKQFTEITNKGKTENLVQYKVWDGDSDVSDNYDLAYMYGQLEITPRNVRVTTANDEWVYNAGNFSNPATVCVHYFEGDGEEIVPDDKPAFVLDHKIKLEVERFVDKAGAHENTCIYKVVTENDEEVTSNYNLHMVYGTLTVKPRPIVITTEDGNRVYDDTPFTHAVASPEEFDGAGERGIVTGHSIVHNESAFTASVTYVTEGKIENKQYYLILDDTQNEVTDNYEITYVYGEIWVTERNITITTNTSSAEFDGEAYSDTGYAVTEGSLAGENLRLEAVEGYSTVTFVTDNEVENKVEYRILQGDADLTKNYAISYLYGKISRSVRYVQIDTNPHNWTYDGEKHSDTGCKNAHVSFVEFDEAGNVIGGTIDGLAGLVLGHKLVAQDITEVDEYTETPVENIVSYIVENEEINKNYCLYMTYGKLSISKRPIIITTANSSHVYDGEPFSYTDDWKVEGGIADGEKLEKGLVKEHTLKVKLDENGNEIKTSVTDVIPGENGEYLGVPNVVEYEVYDGATCVDDNYIAEYVYGTLKLSYRHVVIRTESASKIYDGTPLTCPEFNVIQPSDPNYGLLIEKNHTVIIDESKPLPSITYIQNINGKEVEYIANDLSFVILDGAKNDISKNYKITWALGYIAIEKRALEITTPTLNWDYDGTQHFGNEQQPAFSDLVSVDGISEFAEAYNIANLIDYTENGVTNTTQYRLYNNANKEVETTLCYDITYTYGTLNINKVALDITTLSLQKIYDGAALKGDAETEDKKPVLSGLIATDMYEAYDVAEITDVGTESNTTRYRPYAMRDGEKVDTSINYIFSYTEGTLEVTLREITISTKSDTREYDGVEFTCGVWEDIGENKLVEGHTLKEVEVKGKITDVGTVVNEIIYKVIIAENGSDEVNKNYKINYDYGNLEVTPRNILVTTASHSWVYDGQAHSDDGYEKVVHIKNGEEDGAFALVDGHSLKPIADTATQIATVGEVINEVRFTVEPDMTGNYNITYAQGEQAGKLKITPRPVTITTATDEREYNGTPFIKTDGFKVEPFDMENESGIVDGHTAAPDNVTVSYVTYVHEGLVDNMLSFAITDGSGEVTANYTINVVCGTLSITPHEITVTNPTAEKPYDGEYLYGDDTRIFAGLLFADDFAANDKVAGIIDFGEIENNTTYKIKNADGVEITDSYTIIYTDGATLSITKVSLKITTATLEKVYDGTALKGDDETLGAKPEFTGLIDGEIYEAYEVAKLTGCLFSQNGELLSVDNATRYKIFAERANGRVETTGNYNIEYAKDGTLTVTPRPIVIATPSAEKDYDGEPLYKIDGAGVTYDKPGIRENGLADGQELYVKGSDFVATLTDYADGGVDNRIDYSVRDKDGDVTQNYTIRYWNNDVGKQYGTLIINKRQISLTTATNLWEYDGKEHFEEGYENLTYLGNDGKAPLVKNHQLVAISNTKLTDAGSERNLVEYIVGDDGINNNYLIVYDGYGTVTVTPRKLTVQLNKVLNSIYGEPFAGYPVIDGKIFTFVGDKTTVENEELEITVKYTFNGSTVETPVNAGVYYVDVDEINIIGGKKSNYDITVNTTSFEIEQLSVTISLTPTDTGKVYDGYGYGFLSDSYAVTEGNILDGETLEIAVKYLLDGREISGEPTDVGVYTIVFDLLNCAVNGDKSLANNYRIICNNSLSYEITPLALEFTLSDIQRGYIGTADHEFVGGVTLASRLADTDKFDERYLTIETASGGEVCHAVNAGTYDYTVKGAVIYNADGRDVSHNYDLIEPASAQLKIVPREIKLKVMFDGSSSESREYTGLVMDVNKLFDSTFTSEAVNTDAGAWGIYVGDLLKLKPVFSYEKNGVFTELKELGKYSVHVELANADGSCALSNYKVADYDIGIFEITRRQINVIAELGATDLVYNGEPLDKSLLDYSTKHVFSSEVGFVPESDRENYTVSYSLHRVEGGGDVLDNVLQAGDYRLDITLELKDGCEEKYHIKECVPYNFSVAKRRIYAQTLNDINGYVYNGVAVEYADEYFVYSFDENSPFLNADGADIKPAYMYYRGNDAFDKAVDAGEYTVKIDRFEGFNGDINISLNYEVVDESSVWGKFSIRPAYLVVVPTSYSKDYDGTSDILTLPKNCYQILYVEGNEQNTLFENANLAFETNDNVDIKKKYLLRVKFKQVSVFRDGADISYNYDIILTYSDLKEKLPNYADEFTSDKFAAELKFNQRKIYITQFAPPEQYREIEYGDNVKIELDDYVVPSQYISGDGLIAGHRVEIYTAKAIGAELGYAKQWIQRCKVFDGETEYTKGYEIVIVYEGFEETYVKVNPRKITVSVNFAPSAFGEGVVESDAYSLSNKTVYGDKLELSVVGGKFVANVLSRGGEDKNSYYEIKIVHPEMQNNQKEAEYASRI